MGHIAGSKHDLIPLIDRLNRYPIGLVDNDTLRELLSILFSEEEAYVGSKFPLEEATLDELVRSTGIDSERLITVLESMADKGLVMDLPYGGTTYYLLMPGLIGFFEFTFMKHRTDLPLKRVAQLMHDYFHKDFETGQASEFFGSKTPFTRSIVYDEYIPVSSTVTSFETAREIVKNADFGAAGMCFCRHKKHHLGENCRKNAPYEGICISLGTGARFLSRRGFAEEKTTEELLEIIDEAQSLNLTHITDNIRHRPTFICNCCGCCCEILAGVQMGYYNGVAKTNYIASIDPGKCDYCGDCFTVCNVKCIGLDRTRTYRDKSERVSSVNRDICLGCGACVSACGNGAISLAERDNPQIPKHKKRDLYKAILIEKDRLTPFIVNRVTRKFRSIFNPK